MSETTKRQMDALRAALEFLRGPAPFRDPLVMQAYAMNKEKIKKQLREALDGAV